MKKEKIFLIILISFFFSGLFLSLIVYTQTKEKIINNNTYLVTSLIETHPELETEIIKLLINPQKKDPNILQKYGLTSLESLDYLNDMKEWKRKLFCFFLIYITLFIFLFSLYFYYIKQKQKKEIESIDRYLYSLLSSEINVNLKDFKSGELSRLQNDLLKVTSRLKNALEQTSHSKKELAKNLEDISHQLKTPLTSLTLLNEVLKNSTLAKEKKQEVVQKQSDVIEHMKTLIISLLKVSQIESGTIEFKKEKCSLKEISKNVMEQLEVLIVSKNINIEMKGKEAWVIGDKIWLQEALLNIVKNAIEHSEENGKIIIEINDTPIYTELNIIDFGTGISKKDLPHIFERFYKSSNSKDSIGIGLNMSKSILEKMNATIKAKSIENHKTTFTIHFYKTIV